MKAVLIWLGVVTFFCGLLVSMHLGYLQWFVHPEYTQPMFFWAYWSEICGAIALCAVGASLVVTGVES